MKIIVFRLDHLNFGDSNFVLARWNPAYGGSAERNSTGQGFRIANFKKQKSWEGFPTDLGAEALAVEGLLVSAAHFTSAQS